MVALIVALFLLTGVPSSVAEELCVIGWNLESGDSRIGTLLDTIEDFETCDLFGLSEVASPYIADRLDRRLDQATNVNWHSIVGTTGGGDLLAVIYRPTKLIPIGYEELFAMQGERARAPLAVTFELRESATQFVFLVNHLYRDNSGDNRFKRDNQSESLNRWAKGASLPIIAVGDYNYDLKPSNPDQHNSGFDKLTEGGVFTWVQPSDLIGTQCSDDAKKARSILDFVFVAGAAQAWAATSEILQPQAAFCPDNNKRSDHRPVKAVFTIPESRVAVRDGAPVRGDLMQGSEESPRIGAETGTRDLELDGLTDCAQRRSRARSGSRGCVWRCHHARCFPTIILADEPTGSLHTRTGAAGLKRLRRFNEERGVTVVLVTHSPAAAGYAGRTLTLRDGAIVDDVQNASAAAPRPLRPVL